jgi:site-specific DNA recombinase
MNAVLYARVSTDKQADKELSIPAQLAAMREYANKHGWTISEEFLEPGASARTTERPMLKRMLARCREAPKVDVVVVHKVDRLARDLYGHATIKTLLKQRGIRLASVVENMDDSITGQLVENIMASLAEFYSANLGEEVKKGMRVMVQRGGWPHQPPRGYRQIRTENNRPLLIAEPDDARAIVRAFELYSTGRFSLSDISEELLITGVSTHRGTALALSHVRKLLENPFYCGRVRWNGAEYPGQHEPIISEALFLKVGEVLRRRYKTPGERGRVRFLLRGLATCGECGHLMTAEQKTRWGYYRCVEHAHSRCRGRPSSASVVHAELLTLYRRMKLPADLRTAIRREAEQECKRLETGSARDSAAIRRRVERLAARDLKLTESFTAGDVSPNSYRAHSGRLRRQITEAESQLRAPNASAADWMPRVDRLLDAAASLADLHVSIELSRQQQLLAVVFSRLVLNGNHIIDYALRPPFDALLEPPARLGSARPAQFEQTYLKPAIQSLFEFDYAAFERIVSENRGPVDDSTTHT